MRILGAWKSNIPAQNLSVAREFKNHRAGGNLKHSRGGISCARESLTRCLKINVVQGGGNLAKITENHLLVFYLLVRILDFK